MEKVALIAGRSNRDLALRVAEQLGKPLTNVLLDTFSNGELQVQSLENLRCKHAYIIQTGTASGVSGVSGASEASGASGTNKIMSINDHIVELMLLINMCKLADTRKITVIIPYLPYSRSDKKDQPRVPIGASVILQTLQNLGVNRVISMDLHSSQIQGFFNGPYDNIYAIKLFCDYLDKKILNEETRGDYILISPDTGGTKRIQAYAERLKMDYNIMSKRRDYNSKSTILTSQLNGDGENVKNKTAIVIDDIADTMGTMCAAIDDLKKFGVKSAIILVTHGILSGPAIDRINGCNMIDHIITTNTLPQEENARGCPKLVVLDVSQIVAETVRCCIEKRSVSALFK